MINHYKVLSLADLTPSFTVNPKCTSTFLGWILHSMTSIQREREVILWQIWLNFKREQIFWDMRWGAGGMLIKANNIMTGTLTGDWLVKFMKLDIPGILLWYHMDVAAYNLGFCEGLKMFRSHFPFRNMDFLITLHSKPLCYWCTPWHGKISNCKMLPTHHYDIIFLRIPDSYDAKIVKICNLWTFWPVIQLISPLFKIRPKALLSDFENMFY